MEDRPKINTANFRDHRSDKEWPVVGVYTNKISLIAGLRGTQEKWRKDEARIFSQIAGFRDSEAVFDVNYLIEALKKLQTDMNSEYVKVSLSDGNPISFASTDAEGSAITSVAPVEGSPLPGSVREELLGFTVYCRNDDCEWKRDQYDSREEAVQARNDHVYFTGHETVIYNYNGDKVEDLEGGA